MLQRCYETDNGSGAQLQFVVPDSLRNQVLKEAHGGALSGHLGQETSVAHLQERFYWTGFHTDVKLWCESCEDCGCHKHLPLNAGHHSIASVSAITCSL